MKTTTNIPVLYALVFSTALLGLSALAPDSGDAAQKTPTAKAPKSGFASAAKNLGKHAYQKITGPLNEARQAIDALSGDEDPESGLKQVVKAVTRNPDIFKDRQGLADGLETADTAMTGGEITMAVASGPGYLAKTGAGIAFGYGGDLWQDVRYGTHCFKDRSIRTLYAGRALPGKAVEAGFDLAFNITDLGAEMLSIGGAALNEHTVTRPFGVLFNGGSVVLDKTGLVIRIIGDKITGFAYKVLGSNGRRVKMEEKNPSPPGSDGDKPKITREDLTGTYNQGPMFPKSER